MHDFVGRVRERMVTQDDEARKNLLARAQETPIRELQKLPEIFIDTPDESLKSVFGKRAGF